MPCTIKCTAEACIISSFQRTGGSCLSLHFLPRTDHDIIQAVCRKHGTVRVGVCVERAGYRQSGTPASWSIARRHGTRGRQGAKLGVFAISVPGGMKGTSETTQQRRKAKRITHRFTAGALALGNMLYSIRCGDSKLVRHLPWPELHPNSRFRGWTQTSCTMKSAQFKVWTSLTWLWPADRAILIMNISNI